MRRKMENKMRNLPTAESQVTETALGRNFHDVARAAVGRKF